MNVSPIHIKVNRIERELFETAAKQSGSTITEMVKKAVLAYVKQPMPRDEFAEALSRLKTFVPTEEQLEKHRAMRAKFESGQEEPGLNKKQSLALLKRLQKQSKRR
jgi:uncharacterized protein (DUF1778 family)